MRVETFLQHCISREKFTPEEEADARKFFVDRGIRYIRDWYSQPFKPELIVELFEGIEITPDRHNCYVQFPNHADALIWRVKEILTITYTSHLGNKSTTNTPLILDEFISDCFRNGIELKWKEIEAQDGTR